MKLNIIDVASSVMRAVNKTLSSMCGIVLEDMPEVIKSNIINLAVVPSDDTFASLVILQCRDKTAGTKGGIIVYVSDQNIGTLFSSIGIDTNSDLAEKKDICGEFCNVVAGAFKTEIVALGYEDVNLDISKNFLGSVSEKINTQVFFKYSLSFSYAGRDILLVDSFLEGA